MKKRRRKKRKIKLLLFLFLILMIILVSIILYFININEKSIVKVSMVDELEFDVNSEVKVSTLFTNIENGKLLNEDEFLDTSKVGKRKINVNVVNNYEKEETISFEINVVDNIKPVIECEDKIIIGIGDEVDLLSNVTASDNYDKDLEVVVEGKYDVNVVGKYNLSYVVKDSSGNESKNDFVLVVEKPKYKRMANKTITTNNGYTLKIIDGVAYVDGILIANKTYYLPENYVPKDPYANLSYSCINCLEKDVMNAYQEMNVEAKALGLKLMLSSGYRSYANQRDLYNNYVARDGVVAADTYSARAGHSEHQTGLAFDLNSVSSAFANTNEGKWIADNCYRFGFIIRYPKGKESITGYMYEPWHLRYVGKELSKKLYNNGDWLTLEEYFGIDSEYKG